MTTPTTPIRQNQAQTILLLCAGDRITLQQLADEAELHMQRDKPGAIIALYGISSKQRNGFLLVQSLLSIPVEFWTWMQETPEIVDYLVYDALPLALTELAAHGYQDITEQVKAYYDAFPYLVVLFRDDKEGPVYCCRTEQDVMGLLHRVRQAAQGHEPEVNERGG